MKTLKFGLRRLGLAALAAVMMLGILGFAPAAAAPTVLYLHFDNYIAQPYAWQTTATYMNASTLWSTGGFQVVAGTGAPDSPLNASAYWVMIPSLVAGPKVLGTSAVAEFGVAGGGTGPGAGSITTKLYGVAPGGAKVLLGYATSGVTLYPGLPTGYISTMALSSPTLPSGYGLALRIDVQNTTTATTALAIFYDSDLAPNMNGNLTLTFSAPTTTTTTSPTSTSHSTSCSGMGCTPPPPPCGISGYPACSTSSSSSSSAGGLATTGGIGSFWYAAAIGTVIVVTALLVVARSRRTT